MKTKQDSMKKLNSVMLTAPLLIVLISGCAPCNYVDISKCLKEVYPGQPEGYLKNSDIPDSKKLLPPPPQPGSAALENDREISLKHLESDDSLRRNKAHIDANLDYPVSINSFTGFLNLRISVSTTPHLYILLERVAADASASTYPAKIYYKRPRPFIVNNKPTCDPQSESYLRTSGSYPSGHSAIGWSWALVLTELFPGQADEILQKGREFGESRIVCNVHWNSDVDEGRFMGAATIAALHANRNFQHDLKKSAGEVRRIKSKKVQ